MRIRLAKIEDNERVAKLIAQFRLEHKLLKGIKSTIKLKQAQEEFEEYIKSNYPIFMAENDNNEVQGYIVCRVDDNIVWVESIYVRENIRRSGLASKLFDKAEEIALELGGDTLYNWVLPNNEKIIKFLARRGYNVLNMIEIRKPRKDEKIYERIGVGDYEYYY